MFKVNLKIYLLLLLSLVIFCPLIGQECKDNLIKDECGVCGGSGIDKDKCDCDGNIFDCDGECGGDDLDCFGCTNPLAKNYDINSTVDNGNCFVFTQSTLQAFYFIKDAIDINGNQLEKGRDFIGAFSPKRCVGYRKWNGNYTDVPAMGMDGKDHLNYLTEGEMPIFKIYDASKKKVYLTDFNAKCINNAKEDIGCEFKNLNIYFIDLLRAID